eukprot:16691_1
MEVKKERQLGWDRQNHDNGITFVSDQRIKYSQGQTAACIADYVVKKANHDRFEWSVQIHKYSNASWIGFVDAKKLNTLNYNTFLGDGNCAVGMNIDSTTLGVNGPGKAGNLTTTAMKIGDILKFVADLNKKEMTL